MKTKQKLNSITFAGSVLISVLILFSSIAPAAASGPSSGPSSGYIPEDVITAGVKNIQNMKDSVQQLVNGKTLSVGHGNTLKALLQSAETALINGDEDLAIDSLYNFIDTAKPFLEKESISAGHKEKIQKLIDDANSIISSVQ